MAKQTFTTGQVLLASQLTSLQQTAMLGGSASNKTNSYTLVAADAGTAISMTSTSATTITVNTGLFAAGDKVQITNLGSGVSTITAGTATVNTSASLALAQYESGTLDFTSTSAAIFIKGAGGTSGGLTLISNTVLSANSALDLTSIAGTYKHLFLEWQGVYHSTTGTFFGIRLNNDSGSNYGFIASRASNAAVDTARATDTGIFRASAWPFGEETTSSTLLDTANGSLIIYDYASTSLLKRFKGTWKHRNATGSTDNYVNIDGTYNSQTAITQVNIFN
jgi:hypothetical protein